MVKKKNGTAICKTFGGKRYEFTDTFFRKWSAKACAKRFRKEYHFNARVVTRKVNENVTAYDVYIRKMKGYDKLGKITKPRRVVHRT